MSVSLKQQAAVNTQKQYQLFKQQQQKALMQTTASSNEESQLGMIPEIGISQQKTEEHNNVNKYQKLASTRQTTMSNGKITGISVSNNKTMEQTSGQINSKHRTVKSSSSNSSISFQMPKRNSYNTASFNQKSQRGIPNSMIRVSTENSNDIQMSNRLMNSTDQSTNEGLIGQPMKVLLNNDGIPEVTDSNTLSQGSKRAALNGILKPNIQTNNTNNQLQAQNGQQENPFVPFYVIQAQLRRQHFQKKLREKKEIYKKFIEELETRRQTFSRFSFKSYEKDENPYINPLMQKVNQMDMRGSMGVIDLWEDRALKKYLNYSKLRDGKYMLRGIAQQVNQEQAQHSKDAPTIFTKKDENILKARLADQDQIDSFMKHINDNFSKNEKIIDRKISKNGIQFTHKETSKLNAAALQTTSNLDQFEEDAEEMLPFDDIQFMHHFFMNAEVLSKTDYNQRQELQKQQSQLFTPSHQQVQDYVNKQNSAFGGAVGGGTTSSKNTGFFGGASPQNTGFSGYLQNAEEQKQQRRTQGNQNTDSPMFSSRMAQTARQNTQSLQNVSAFNSPRQQPTPLMLAGSSDAQTDDTIDKEYKFQGNKKSAFFQDENLNKHLKKLPLHAKSGFHSPDQYSSSQAHLRTGVSSSSKIQTTRSGKGTNYSLTQKTEEAQANEETREHALEFINLYVGKLGQHSSKNSTRILKPHYQNTYNKKQQTGYDNDIDTPMNSFRPMTSAQQFQQLAYQQQSANTPSMKKALRMAKMDSMFRDIENLQQSETYQKKRIDDLIEKMQDRVIFQEEKNKKANAEEEQHNANHLS